MDFLFYIDIYVIRAAKETLAALFSIMISH